MNTQPIQTSKTGNVKVELVLPVDVYAAYVSMANDFNVELEESLIQGLRFALKSRQGRAAQQKIVLID